MARRTLLPGGTQDGDSLHEGLPLPFVRHGATSRKVHSRVRP